MIETFEKYMELVKERYMLKDKAAAYGKLFEHIRNEVQLYIKSGDLIRADALMEVMDHINGKLDEINVQLKDLSIRQEALIKEIES